MQFLLWDHDGVLVDTERWYFEATRLVLERAGVALSEPDYLRSMAVGRGSWNLLRDRGMSEEEIGARRDERNALYQEFLRTKPIEIEGVDEVLGALAACYRMGIVTTARRDDFKIIHEHRDLLRHFEFTLTIEDYDRSKPHPDPYLAGLDRFGARAADAVALEDSARGLTAARAAGLRCLVIRNEFTASQDFAAASQVVDSIRAVPGALDALSPATRSSHPASARDTSP